MINDEREDDQSRRSFVKKAVYVAPVIITLDAMPAFASHECSWSLKEEGYHKEKDKENYKKTNEEYYKEKEEKEKKEKKDKNGD